MLPVVAVLGASGFVGSAVVAELARSPVRVRAVSRSAGFALSGIDVRQVDLSEPGSVATAVEGADIVLHLAAHISGEQSWRSATDLSQRLGVGVIRELVEHDRPPGVVIFASTLQASCAHRIHAGYVRQKLDAEEMLLRSHEKAFSLRLPTVYGRSPVSGSTGRGVISAMAGKAAAGERLTMWHDGSVARDLVHVTDVARAFAVALTCADTLAGRSWAIGTGRPERLGGVFSTIAAITAARSGEPPVPVVSVAPPDYADSGDFHSCAPDCSAFPAVTGWRPRIALADGLREVVATRLGAPPEPGKAPPDQGR
ncbi:NAD-dependent epimerase/dehydratase family protein [Actinocrispum sp. NPDC049592]|uniref:NAD-dependent epimerase/dehydratase family protein n=1 Tax=Actinocrispum sp. NPDC049592 TaxID=3154835 RepID=UPI00342DFDFC